MNSASLDFPYRLNRLFETRTKPDGTPYTEQELVIASGGILTLRQLRRLRSGQSINPSIHVVKAVASFFQVDAAYFSVSTEEASKQIASWSADSKAIEIAVRSMQLDDEGKQQILQLIDTILANGKQFTGNTGQDQDNQPKGGV